MSFKILLVGIGGYAKTYVDAIFNSDRKNIEVEGVVDPIANRSERYQEFVKREIPIYDSMEEFYKNHNADLAVISSPIQFHKRQSIFAMKNKSNVLCEKPIAARVEDAKEMIEVSREYKKKIAVGFQWSYSDAIVNLKKDIQKGVLGKPKRLKTLVLWPRDSRYYQRNNWAGRIKNDSGDWILDSVANNATAHYMHNMFFVLGDNANTSDEPKEVEAQIYKANDIENYDTAAFRIKTKKGASLLYLVSHAVENDMVPIFEYEFQKGKVILDESEQNQIIAYFNDGRKKVYGNPNDGYNNKLWKTIDAIINDTEVGCLVQAALQHTKVVNSVQNMFDEIPIFKNEHVKEKILDKKYTLKYVTDLEKDFRELYASWKMPFEENLKWDITDRKITKI